MAVNRDGDGPPLRRGKDPEGEGLRATPFTEDVFDDDYYGRSGRATGGKPFGLVAGVVFGIAIAAGAGWFLIEQRDGLLNEGPVEIKADASPYKVRPEDPGGMEVANQDKLVYERVAPGEAPPRVENLLAPAAAPKAPPPPKPDPPAARPETPSPAAAADAAAPEAKPAVAEPAVQDKPVEQAPAVPVRQAQTPDTPAEPQVDPLAAAVAAVAEGRTSVTNRSPAAAQPQGAMATLVPEPPQVASAMPEPQAGAQPQGPAFLVQLASVGSEDAAKGEWTRLSSRHQDLLGGLTSSIERADLGERGVFFRLRAGPLAGQAEADRLCAALAAQNVGCLVIRP